MSKYDHYVLLDKCQARFEIGVFRFDKDRGDLQYYDWQQSLWEDYHTDDKPDGLALCTEEFARECIANISRFC